MATREERQLLFRENYGKKKRTGKNPKRILRNVQDIKRLALN